MAKDWLTNDFLRTPFGQSGGVTLGLYLYTNLVETEVGFVDWRFSKSSILQAIQQGRGQDHWDWWKNLKVPTCVIRGQNSTDLSQSVFEQMLRTQPRARGVVIPEAGHWVHFDQPDLFAKAVIDFIEVTRSK